MLADLIEATQEDFPDISNAVTYLTRQCEHFSEGLRKSSIIALWRTYQTWHTIVKEGPWTPGFPATEHG